jgi:malate dehydrogenase (oxaloacetate-decarboxylating)(NADP+)
VLRNWPHKDVRIIVITDGERILGLGDLGAHGMGIPIGKLSLYIACAGIRPDQCLPITLDVGTNIEELRNDPIYIGLPQPRLRGKEYEDLLDEFVTAAVEMFPRALIQFEDFATTNAFRLLKTYGERICTFDDDIQGTGSVALAGIYSALRITGGDLAKERFLLLGAGEAGVGIANLIMAAMIEEGLSEQEARERCWLMDSKGLVVKSRKDLAEHKLAFAHDHAPAEDLESVIRALRPAGLIGVSGQPGAFTQPVVEAMGDVCERPIIFALSNPTSKAECTARQAYEWTNGRAIFASGSPFGPVDFEDRTFVPGQGNNAYIFPGVGLGAIACESTTVTNEMFFVAARALADQVSDADLDIGRVYPALSRIREVSAKIATAVAEVAYERGFARRPRPDDLEAYIREQMYEPDYQS